MGNIYTGSNSGKAGLNVKKTDNTVDVFGVSQIQLGNNMTLVNNGNGSVTVNSTGGGGGGGVTELSFGSTGLTPAVATTGSITVAGTLEVGSGGTGLTSLGSANEFLKVNNGATALEYSTGLTYVSTAGSRQLKITDSSTDAMLVLESTDTGTTNAPDLKLFRNKSPPATDDVLGQIKFTALEGNTATEVDYARIEARIDNGGLATYGGSLDFYITNDAAEVRMLTISGEIVGSPNMSFDVNPDGDIDGDFRHFSSGGTVNIFSDAQNRTLDIAPIKNYGFGGTATPLDGELLIGNGSTFSKANLTSTGGSITITNGAGTINLETAVAGYSGWIAQGGGGLTTTIDSGDTLEIAGGTGITTTLSGTGTTTPTLTIDVDGTSPTGTGVANQVTYWSGANTITGDAGLQWNPTGGSERLTVTGSSASDMLRIVSTNTGTGTAPDIAFVRDRTYTAGLDLGIVLFKGPDAADAEHTYAWIQADAKDGTVGNEKGQMDFRVGDGTGGNGFPLRLSDTGAHFNVVNATGLDVRMDSASTDNAFLLDASENDILTQVPFRNEIEIQSTDGGAAVAPDLKLYRNSASPAANDVLGQVLFSGQDDDTQKINYASITGFAVDVATAQPDGAIVFNCLRNGTSAPYFDIGKLVSGVRAMTVNPNGLDNDFYIQTVNQSEAFKMDGSADTATFNVSFIQTTANPLALPPTEGGSITSNTSTVEMAINTGVALAQEIGLKQTAAAHQVELGKTTTQSFGQTQNLSLAALPTDFYPSQGGLIVCDDLTGNATQIINLACMIDSLGAFSPNANPPNLAGGGTPVADLPDKSGYGTWQIGDQVTVLTRFTGGGTPNITILSYAGVDDGAGGSSDPSNTAGGGGAPNQQISINGVTTGTTITSNYSAKTFILTEDPTTLVGVSWVAIG